jgi:hypothetical protein
MVVSADFEKQRQYFDKKNCHFIAISLVKIARVTRALYRVREFDFILSMIVQDKFLVAYFIGPFCSSKIQYCFNILNCKC